MHRAAQYVRMSTDYQQYSIQNQAVVIATYAELHKLTIVRTYRDEGESGLRIENRKGLTELIDDIQVGQTDFDHLLIFDVSRWGRFQAISSSAFSGEFAIGCRLGLELRPNFWFVFFGCHSFESDSVITDTHSAASLRSPSEATT